MVSAVFLCLRAFAEYDYSTVSGTNASGAAVSYDKTLEVNVVDLGADPGGKKNSAAAFQKALDMAKTDGSDSVIIKINVPEGKYILGKTLYIYSHTWVCADENAVMVRNHAAGSIIRNAQANNKGGYDGDKDIIIEGGVWDGSPSASSYEFSNMRFGHMSDLVIKNAVIKNNYNGHHIELGGARRVTIDGCEVCGFTGKDRKEAIQLDTMINSSVFNSYAPFDNTPCDNVVIKNCYFHDLDRAIGSHSAMLGVYYTNIVISGNRFEKLSGSAIPMINYKACIIENNDISSCGNAIDIKHMALDSMEYYYGWSGAGTDSINDNANIIIRNNTIKNKVTGYVPKPYAIRLYGKYVSGSSYLPNYNFAVRGVKIIGNTICSAGSAIAMVDSSGVFIDSNDITFNSEDKHLSSADTISISGSSDVTVTKNKLAGGIGSGIAVSGGKGNIITSNTLSDISANGIAVSGSNECDIESNVITSPSSHAIRVADGCKSVKIMYNKTASAGGHALLLKGSSVEAGGNEFNASASNALAAEDGSVVKYYANDASDNTNYGIKASGGSTVYISTDTFDNNGKGNIFADEDSSIFLNSAKNFGTAKVTSTTVELSWDEISMAESYRIYRRVNLTDGDFIFLSETEDTAYTDETALPATRYTYEVVGVINTESGEYEGKNADVSLRTHLSISACESDIPERVVFTGSASTPMFNVYLDGCELVKDVDYDVVYTNNISLGRAKVTILGKGQYCDSKDFEFDIVLGRAGALDYRPAEASALSTAYSPKGTSMAPDECTVYTVKAMKLERTGRRIRFASMKEPADYINELKKDAPALTVRSVRHIGGEYIYGAELNY